MRGSPKPSPDVLCVEHPILESLRVVDSKVLYKLLVGAFKIRLRPDTLFVLIYHPFVGHSCTSDEKHASHPLSEPLAKAREGALLPESVGTTGAVAELAAAV